MTRLFAIFLVLVLIGCGTQKELAKQKLKHKNTTFLVENLKKNEFDCKTISLKAGVVFKVDGKSDKFKMHVRMVKDSVIWLSATYFSLEAARFLITPDSVQFMDRRAKKYFKGDIDFINDQYDIDVDFYVLQSLLLGNAVGIDQKDRIKTFIENGYYHLSAIKPKRYRKGIQKPKKGMRDIAYSTWLDPKTYKVSKVRIHDFKYEKSLVASFLNHQKVGSRLFPTNIDVVVQTNKMLMLNIEYSKITADLPIKCSFKIPSKYEPMY